MLKKMNTYRKLSRKINNKINFKNFIQFITVKEI